MFFKWMELLLQNKTISSILLLLVSALVGTTYTAVEQDKELKTLREPVVVEVTVEAPVEPVEYNHNKILEDIKKLQNEVQSLRKWH